MKKNRIITILLVISILLSGTPGLFNKNVVRAEEIELETLTIEEHLENSLRLITETTPNPNFGVTGGEWAILSLARGEYNVPEGYYDTYYNNVIERVQKLIPEGGEKPEGVLDANKGSEHSRLILGLTSIGKDIKDVVGYDISQALSDYNYVIRQGINGPIFALISLNSHGYEIPVVKGDKVQSTRELFIEYILSKEINKGKENAGGWALGGNNPDPDITSMAIQGLSPYYESNDNVKAAVDRGIEWLSKAQKEGGGYASWGTINSESAAQVIVALTGLGIDPHTDSRFIKNGKSVIDGLMDFAVEGGGFFHIPNGKLDAMATEQGTYALVAYDRFIKGKTSLYNMSDVSIDKAALPTIIVEGLEDNKTFKEEEISFKVIAKDNKDEIIEPIIKLNGEIITGTNGDYKLILIVGENIIEIEATDKAGNKTDLKYKLRYEAIEEGEGSDDNDIITDPTPTPKKGNITLSIDKHTINKGYVLNPTNVEFSEGESVWDVVKREMDDRGIQYSHRFTSQYSSVYIESIAGDGEFDHGSGSGWMYNVNGWYPNYGASQYSLKDGDIVQWRYTKDLGADLGEDLSQWQGGSTTGNTGEGNKENLPNENAPVDKKPDNNNEEEEINVDLIKTYDDLDSISSWAIKSIKEATEKGFVAGSKGKFNPKSNITRAEITKIIVNILELDINRKSSMDFKDIKESDWFYPYINAAYRVGIVEGDNGRFNPNENITREQMATMISRALNIKEVMNKTKIKDMNKVSKWAVPHVERVVSLGIIVGDNGVFDPQSFATREMATVVAMRAYDYKNKLEEDKEVKQPHKDITKTLEETGKLMYTTISNPTVGTLAGEWTVFGLARSGIKVPSNYYENYYKNVEDYVKERQGKLHHIKYTEYSRLILALTALGKDVTNVGGYDLIKPLADFNTLIKQGINGPIFALISLDSNNYKIPIDNEVEVQTTREKLIEFILDREIKGGGWALGANPSKADPDITSMAIQSLSPYYEENKDVKNAIDKGIKWLSENQENDGGYASWDSINSESVAQVIVALTGLGIDPYNDERFVKNGNSAIDALLSFAAPEGGFYHIKPNDIGNGGASPGEVDPMAIDQAMYALVAYHRFINEKTPLYNMTDVK